MGINSTLKKTVLVLGAGASKPYGFPTGAELAMELSQSAGSLRETLKKTIGTSAGTLPPYDIVASTSDFIKKFRASGCSTLDEYIGRIRTPSLAIACTQMLSLYMLQREIEFARRFVRPSDWYHDLFRLFYDPTTRGLRTTDFAVITFNYDRSLEYSLQAMLHGNDAGSWEETRAAVQQVEILHIHGATRNLDHPPPDDESTIPDPDPVSIIETAKNIRLVSADNGAENIALVATQATRARDLLKKASDIVFLGFGFHMPNLRTLGIGAGVQWHAPNAIVSTSTVRWDMEQVDRYLALFSRTKSSISRNRVPLDVTNSNALSMTNHL